MADITMPKMGFDMTEGTIARWLKQPGDQNKKGEEIAEIETDKVTIAIEAFASGTLGEIVVQEGQTAPVGSPIARLHSADDGVAAAPQATAQPTAQPTTAAKDASAAPQPTAQATAADGGDAAVAPQAVVQAPAADQQRVVESGNGHEVKASPLAKRMAEESGVDLRQISGSGPGGRIVRDDVQSYLAGQGQPTAAAAQPAAQPAPQPVAAASQPVAQPTTSVPQPTAAPAAPAAPATDTVVPLSNMRRTISRRMVQSWQTPHFFVSNAVDMGAALALRKQINADLPKESQISVNDIIVKACATALLAFPNINASYTEAGIERHSQVNISVAVALDDGLIAPVIANCQDRSLGAIARESKRLVGLARAGKLTAENVQGGTFTVSNLGMYGVTDFIAIITAPQAAVLAIGGVQRVPVFKDDSDEIVAKQLMNITISADHRVTDGAEAARFISEVRRLLEAPMQLLVG
jgi:pyruvate dehydrogenase E2 component (dihydrolipoamide acetyltransferase)